MDEQLEELTRLQGVNRVLFSRIIQINAYFDRIQSQRTGQKTFIDLKAESKIDEIIEETRKFLDLKKQADY